MFKLEESIRHWRNQMIAAGIQSPVPLDELEAHLRDQIQQLIASGHSEPDAFHAAARTLGDGRTLRKEFTKVNRHWLWIYRDNPLSLKILAASFLVAGLDPLITTARVAIAAIFHGPGLTITSALGLMFPYWFFMILIGLGLLRRSNAWRWTALVVSGLYFSFVLLFQIAVLFGGIDSLAQSVPHPETDFVMGIELPFAFSFSLKLLESAIMSWGLYLLNKSSIRALFRRDAETKTA